ncbi:MAG: hypothetical protein NDJ90_03340, partial [Oligoflexia bacterium]|nr:hypothetical protein [Oligoflexia bacterium]
PATRAGAPTGATPRAAAAGPERTVRPPVSRGAARPAARFAGPRLQLRAFGGLANYGAPELNAQLGLNSFSSAMTGGVEVAYSLSRSLAVAFRAEYLTRTVLASDDSQYPVVEYNLVLTSLPLALGAEYSLLENSSFSIRAGLLVGSAPSTRLTATASNLEAPNEVVLSGNAWQALVKTDFEFKFSRSFGVFAGVGYRYLKTAELIPASEANGDALFRPAGGEIDAPFVPVPLNLSGLLFGAGANLRF